MHSCPTWKCVVVAALPCATVGRAAMTFLSPARAFPERTTRQHSRMAGRPGAYFALAGDHFCNGCHAGHTFTSADVRERLR